MVECEEHSQDVHEDVDLIDFSEPDEEIHEDINIEDVNELLEQGIYIFFTDQSHFSTGILYKWDLTPIHLSTDMY
jgi:hypothetical protein